MSQVENKDIPVEQFRSDWALALMSNGVIVKLSVSRWRANAKLTPETLGLRFSNEDGFDFSRKYLELGRQKLLPPEVLNEIETLERRARETLAAYSFDTVWGKFVPYTAFDRWEKENAIIQKDFLQQAVVFGNRYDAIIGLVKEEYKKMARDVWMRLYPEDKAGATVSFVEDFVGKIIAKIPSREDIVSSFQYSVTYLVIPMPSFVEDNIAKADQIKRQEEMAKFESELEKQTKTRIKEEYVKRKKELIDGFLESTVLHMRKYVCELCDAVLMSINKRGYAKITSAHINRLKSMIKKVKLLNFYNDKEISTLISDLDNELDKIKGEVNHGVVAEKLVEIVDAAKREYMPRNFNPSISVLEV
jgi:hypothetical protein